MKIELFTDWVEWIDYIKEGYGRYGPRLEFKLFEVYYNYEDYFLIITFLNVGLKIEREFQNEN